MQIADGVTMLEISAILMGKKEVIYPTLLRDKDAFILVDTGYPGQAPKIREAVEQAGVRFEKLNRIILTHQDLDHIGGLPALLGESSQTIEVLASEVEKPYIQGQKMLLKLTPEAIAQAVNSLPDEVPEQWRKAFKATLENPPKAPVDRTIADSEELPYCGGVIVINTPGHTPGHISLYHKQSKTLIAGDAMVVENGQLQKPDPNYSSDINEAVESLKKLSSFDIETVICYHGGVFKGKATERIAELAKG
jgi:glyoxylase-like metal-dependent hydrolase (beta-lactamase superfamily II)